MSQRAPDWDTDGRSWPNRASSHFLEAAGLRWHVQLAGDGPVLLLLHGTAASTHSWADLLPHLARRYRVVAPDLPGHGFTRRPPDVRLGLDGMAADVGALLAVLGVSPALAVGHSAGATILARQILDRVITPAGLAVLNHSLRVPFGPAVASLASASARLARSPAAAWLASHLATPAVVDNRLRSTGSVLSPAAVERYQVLLRAPSHVGAALSMMSRWNLAPLERDLARLTLPVLLVAGERDSWFPPATLTATAALLPHARATVVRATGHLSHEERPEAVAELLLSFGAEVGARAPAD